MQPDKHGNRYFQFAQERLHGARKPDDWLRWLLNLAATTSDEALAQHCFQGVARAVIDTKPTSFDVPSKEEIENWVAEHATQWPNAPQWLQSACSSSLEEIERRQRVNADYPKTRLGRPSFSTLCRSKAEKPWQLLNSRFVGAQP
jgi:hypothetical protein